MAKKAAHASLSASSFHATDLARAPLSLLCDLVVSNKSPYSDLAEHIENRAYDAWSTRRGERAIADLRRVAAFFEQMENKNEENTRDLAEVYALIGQLLQDDGRFEKSIEWFERSVSADDGNPQAFHGMGVSCLRLGALEDAARCFEQELTLDDGNYAIYLDLASLYDRLGKSEGAESWLEELLSRDPENIQALDALIRHYRKNNHAIDTGLLVKRLLKVSRPANQREAMIKAFHLDEAGMCDDALNLLASHDGRTYPPLFLVEAHLLAKMKRMKKRDGALDAFLLLCHSNPEMIRGHVATFAELFGEKAGKKITGLLHRTSPF